MEHNSPSEEFTKYCVQHGHIMHFLGTVIEDEYMCEAVICSGCYPDHPENPILHQERYSIEHSILFEG